MPRWDGTATRYIKPRPLTCPSAAGGTAAIAFRGRERFSPAEPRVSFWKRRMRGGARHGALSGSAGTCISSLLPSGSSGSASSFRRTGERDTKTCALDALWKTRIGRMPACRFFWKCPSAAGLSFANRFWNRSIFCPIWMEGWRKSWRAANPGIRLVPAAMNGFWSCTANAWSAGFPSGSNRRERIL